MTLTDLANHICTQCGMTDTDDVAAAQMFLQRRLEMIWNSALWRDSLLEATLTINPSDTTTLADSYWISERSVLLLPSAIEKVIAARLSTNTLEVASLESYYRADTDWLDYQGTPFEFQILKPVVMEWPTAQIVAVSDSNGADGNITCNYSFSPDGVTICAGSANLNATIGTGILQMFSFSKAPTQGNVTLQQLVSVSVSGVTYTGSPQSSATVTVTQGQTYTVTPGANENGVTLINGTQSVTLATGTAVQITAQGNSITFQAPGLIPAGTNYLEGEHRLNGIALNTQYNLVWGVDEGAAETGQFQAGMVNPGAGQVTSFNSGAWNYIQLNSTAGALNGAVTAQVYAANIPLTVTITCPVTFATVMASCNTPPLHQRIRLTEAPTVSLNLRVLGKGKCPILGPYDTAPITNVEPALMAFARGDLLLRQRQFGKAALAQQEGAALLKELVESEAFQQAGEFRIEPEAGFGSDIWWRTTPDSYHPLG
ncbi:MAG TPA: hypothetical protein VMF08_13610 [Candidatus Sulfotelmatobacter sp.]|nr:hypothetical protein [Candidatus Sulfotelmatobacter sp.]